MPHVTKAAVVRISDAQYFILRVVVGDLFLCTRVRTWPQTCKAYMHTEKMMMYDGEEDEEVRQTTAVLPLLMLCCVVVLFVCYKT